MSQSKLRWGILGCAAIAFRAVIPGIRASQRGEVVAIASRNIEKAKEAAEKEGIPTFYGSYEELLADKNIDAVYIPLPNHIHMEWTVKAAEAGKHVLCEKPLAMNAEEASIMVDACNKAGVYLAEAFMYRHHPRYDRIKEIIRSGEIGELRGIHAVFTFNGAGNKENIRFKQSMGGGSIYDVGVYPISAARYILESEPEAATVHAFHSPEHDHVDMMASGLLEFPNHVGLTFDCAMWAAFRNSMEILGTEGRIELPYAFLSKGGSSANFFVTVQNDRREEEVSTDDPYALQSDDLANAVFDGKALKIPSEDAIKNMRVVDACLKSGKERKRIVIQG